MTDRRPQTALEKALRLVQAEALASLREELAADLKAYVDSRLGQAEATGAPPAPDWLTIAEVSQRYSIPKGTFHEWKADPDSGLAVHCMKPGRRVLVNRLGFEGWLRARG